MAERAASPADYTIVTTLSNDISFSVTHWFPLGSRVTSRDVTQAKAQAGGSGPRGPARVLFG